MNFIVIVCYSVRMIPSKAYIEKVYDAKPEKKAKKFKLLVDALDLQASILNWILDSPRELNRLWKTALSLLNFPDTPNFSGPGCQE